MIRTDRPETWGIPGPAVYRAIVERLAAAVGALSGSLARENPFVRGSLQLPPVDVEAEVRAPGR